MSILNKIGITKDAIAKLLGISRTVDVPQSKQRRFGRPVGHKIDQKIVDAIRKAPKSYTIKELADKYEVSTYWVWSVRHNKIRVK